MGKLAGFMAPIYDKAARMAKDYYKEVADEVLSQLSSGVILDLGTGPGYLPIELARRSSLKVIGIDLTPKMIKLSWRNAKLTGVQGQVSFKVTDAASLDFKADTFKVLKPGGELWIYDPARVCSSIDIQAWKSSLTFKERLLNKLFWLRRKFRPPHYYSSEEVAEMAAGSKFDTRHIRKEGEELKAELRKKERGG